MKNKPLVIIPAAGWGTRVGTPPAKELLAHPKYPQHSFLEQALAICKSMDADPLVVSRVSKSVLNNWLKLNLPSSSFLIIEHSTEWTDTLLQTAHLWRRKNILMLPDTHWQPLAAINSLILALDQNHLALLLHQVTDPQHWGMVSTHHILEKPQQPIAPYMGAWGLVGFTNQPQVLEFWQNYHHSRQRQVPIALPAQTWMGYLDSFEDLTRTTQLL